MTLRRLGATVVAVLAVAGCSPGAVPSRQDETTSVTTPPPTASPVIAAPSTTAATTPAPTRSTPPPIPSLSAKAKEAGLVDIRTVVPDAVVDLRYATRHNFVGIRLYPRDARCLVHDSMTPGLRTAARELRKHHDVLVFWDCYRPHSVQVRMFAAVPNPDWVARPGPYARSHEAARSIDVTVAHRGRYLDMGTGFDDFTPRAYAFATDVSARARANRALLRAAMAAGGLAVYSGEWWHFDGPGSLIPRPHLDVPLD